MESYLFKGLEVEPDHLVVEGWHKPGSLTQASGVWIHAAGGAMLAEAGSYAMNPVDQWIWIAVEHGEADLVWNDSPIHMEEGQFCILPAKS